MSVRASYEDTIRQDLPNVSAENIWKPLNQDGQLLGEIPAAFDYETNFLLSDCTVSSLDFTVSYLPWVPGL